MTKTAEKPYSLAAHTYIAHTREYPPPPRGGRTPDELSSGELVFGRNDRLPFSDFCFLSIISFNSQLLWTSMDDSLVAEPLEALSLT